MKKTIVLVLIGAGMLMMNGCETKRTNDSSTEMKCNAGKCESGKCKGAPKETKKTQAGKCGEGKCGGK